MHPKRGYTNIFYAVFLKVYSTTLHSFLTGWVSREGETEKQKDFDNYFAPGGRGGEEREEALTVGSGGVTLTLLAANEHGEG